MLHTSFSRFPNLHPHPSTLPRRLTEKAVSGNIHVPFADHIAAQIELKLPEESRGADVQFRPSEAIS